MRSPKYYCNPPWIFDLKMLLLLDIFRHPLITDILNLVPTHDKKIYFAKTQVYYLFMAGYMALLSRHNSKFLC